MQGKRADYTYRLKAKTGAYLNGLMSPTGYYKLSVAGGQYTTYTYWWQVRRTLDAWQHLQVIMPRKRHPDYGTMLRFLRSTCFCGSVPGLWFLG